MCIILCIYGFAWWFRVFLAEAIARKCSVKNVFPKNTPVTAFALAAVGYYRKIELFKILPNLSVLFLCFCYCFSCFCFVLFLFFSQRNWDWKIAGVNKQSWPEKQVKLLRIVFLKVGRELKTIYKNYTESNILLWSM